MGRYALCPGVSPRADSNCAFSAPSSRLRLASLALGDNLHCAFSAPILRLRLFCFHISILPYFNLVGLFMRKSPTTNLSKQGTEVTNSHFALKYAKNEGLTQMFDYQENIDLAKQKDNSRVAKAPFLHPESSAFGISYTMFWEPKSATLGVQERCFWKTAQPLPVCKSRQIVNEY